MPRHVTRSLSSTLHFDGLRCFNASYNYRHFDYFTIYINCLMLTLTFNRGRLIIYYTADFGILADSQRYRNFSPNSQLPQHDFSFSYARANSLYYIKRNYQACCIAAISFTLDEPLRAYFHRFHLDETLSFQDAFYCITIYFTSCRQLHAFECSCRHYIFRHFMDTLSFILIDI